MNKSKESIVLADVKQRLTSDCEQQRLIALEEALTLGQEGLNLFTQQALQDKSEKIQQSAYWILHQHNPYQYKNPQGLISSQPICPTDTITCVAIKINNISVAFVRVEKQVIPILYEVAPNKFRRDVTYNVSRVWIQRIFIKTWY